MGRQGGQGGSVALEYILMLSVCCIAYACWIQVFEPGVGFTEFGRMMTASFQRVLVGVSLQIP